MKKSIPYIVLAVLAGAAVLAQSLASEPPLSAETAPPTLTAEPPTEAPTADSSISQCAYTWAYHNADELGAMIDAEMRGFDPAASGNASFFGEDCIYADGHSTFGAMETDFYVRIPVNDLADEELFGNWISQVLRVVLDFPRELIQGNYGFVEFWFEKSEGEHVIVRVSIQRFKDGTHGISGAALFRMFYVQP
jgi:hypothetical protein